MAQTADLAMQAFDGLRAGVGEAAVQQRQRRIAGAQGPDQRRCGMNFADRCGVNPELAVGLRHLAVPLGLARDQSDVVRGGAGQSASGQRGQNGGRGTVHCKRK